jgi:hypothetical protein
MSGLFVNHVRGEVPYEAISLKSIQELNFINGQDHEDHSVFCHNSVHTSNVTFPGDVPEGALL